MSIPTHSEFKVTYGGWYQRTTLHLSEIYNFFVHAFTYTELSKKRLAEYRQSLDLIKVTRETGYLEYVQAKTSSGIIIRYYEDGLYILELEGNDIKTAHQQLTTYFENIFNPALNYLFSLGAPTPKILANIKLSHPTAVSVIDPSPDKWVVNYVKYGQVYSEISSKNLTVHKTPQFIFIVSKKDTPEITQLLENQIFFREYKDQLEKYLNIHRKIWEEIESIKERKRIRGSEIAVIRDKLEKYLKTVSLISNRINQMESYIPTRSSIARKQNLEEHLLEIFQYKFETLTDTHLYIQEIWKMTESYLKATIAVIVELKNESTKNSITSLTVITTIGVVAGIMGYLSKDSLPTITSQGIIFFALLITLTAIINFIVKIVFKNINYKLNLYETDNKI